jgi:asparagine synthase (glutamine-hydrolysing)
MYRRMPGWLLRIVEPSVVNLPSLRGTDLKSGVRLAKKMVRSASLSPRDSFLTNSTYLDKEQKSRLYAEEWRALTEGFEPWSTHLEHFNAVGSADFLHQMQYVDVKAFLVSLNLTYNDKMSMAMSVEVRVPFLDRELVEFVAAEIPPEMKLSGFLWPTTKYILRKAMTGVLSEEVLRQPKTPFGAPVDYWLADDLREMVDDLLSAEQVRRRGFFRPEEVQTLIKQQRSGQHDWSMQLWQLLTLELWMQNFKDRSTRAIQPELIPATQPI